MKKYLYLLGIVIFGLILRLICINKADGLWNDEYVSYMISAKPFFNGFLDGIKSQCHMPFYYLYLKFFMSVFGQSDILLRLTSVIAGVAAIPVMYFVGKEKDNTLAYLCSGFTAISSFLIYYSQEVRLYSILFLFSALSLLYTIKIIKNPVRKNFILYILFNFLILFTHTIGFVFVFFNLIFLSLNLYEKFKDVIKKVWICAFIGGLILSPLVINVFMTESFSQWWGHFSIARIGFLFTDYFSPVLTNLTNAPDNLFYMPKLAIYMFIPALIAIFGIIKSLINNKFNIQLFSVALFTTIVLIIASISGKLVFITKYSIEIYPILIYLACYGIQTVNKKWLKNSIIVIYCLLSVWYLIRSPQSAPKIRRAEGHKIVADLLNNSELKNGDIILLQYYDKNRFLKYFDFSDYYVVSINKGNFYKYLLDGYSYSDTLSNGKNIYKNIFSTYNNPYFENIINNKIINKLKPGQSVAVIVLDSVSFINPDMMSEITKNETLYSKQPLLFLVFSYIKNKTFYDMAKTLTLTRVERKGRWTLIKFTKLNNL